MQLQAMPTFSTRFTAPTASRLKPQPSATATIQQSEPEALPFGMARPKGGWAGIMVLLATLTSVLGLSSCGFRYPTPEPIMSCDVNDTQNNQLSWNAEAKQWYLIDDCRTIPQPIGNSGQSKMVVTDSDTQVPLNTGEIVTIAGVALKIDNGSGTATIVEPSGALGQTFTRGNITADTLEGAS